MPRKNKEEYNEYMRNYMKKKSRAIAGKPLMDDDYDASAVADGKPTFDMSSVNKATGALKEVFAKKGESSTEEDPVLKTIEKYSKYIPLVMEFVKGFQAAAKDSSMFAGQQQKQDNTPQPPAGWINMGAMEKLRFKYSRPDWYEAGLRYDEFVQTGQINPQINTSYVDSTYDDAAARRREQMAQRNRIAAGQDGTNPQTLRELSKKYPELPLASDSPPMESNISQEPSKENEKEKNIVDSGDVLRTSDGASKNAEVPKEENQETEIVKELQLDNARYIQMGVQFLNGLPMKKFEEHIKNIDGLVAKAKPFIPLIPIQVKGMLQNTPAKDIEEIVKAQCPEKYAWLKKNKKIPKLLELFEKLKAEVFK
jgi:hypothetical protein